MLWMTENDLKIFFGETIRNVSRELKIKDWQWQHHSELLEKITESSKSAREKLDSFFSEYKKWHDFHVKINEQGNFGNLSQKEDQELQELITKRDSSRENLLSSIRG